MFRVDRTNRPRIVTRFEGDSMTKQDPELETNINRIVEKHRRTGQITHLSPVEPSYGDFSAAQDLQGALELADTVQRDFERLNGKIRKAAGNSAVTYLEMLATPEGVAELQAAGMQFPGDPDPYGVAQELPPLNEPAVPPISETPPPPASSDSGPEDPSVV